MIKIISILLYLSSYCSADGDIFSFLSTILLSNDTSPIRVRTVEERDRRKDESVVLDFIGLVQQYEGYTAEEYSVTTEDNYILGLHRITGSPSHPKTDGKKVVYIQHGLLGSSDFMIVMGPKKSIAFELADAGYDVWLGNIRGNVYSKAHTSYSTDPKSYSFWNFRMDDMATKDLPAFIDFILDKTKQNKLTYIGYSMGTTLSYMLLSSKPEYNSKMNIVISLAPVVYFSTPISMTFYTVMNAVISAANLKLFVYEVLPISKATYEFGKDSCSDESNRCSLFLSLFTNISKMNVSMIPEILAHSPGGTSYYTLKQYQQLSAAKRKFSKYDFGCQWTLFCANQAKYNRNTPPEYDISLVTAPIALYYGEADIFSKVEDVEYLKSKLMNVKVFEKVPDPKFNHLDFIWNDDVKTLVYDRVLADIGEHVQVTF